MSTDETENGWDALAENLGIESSAPVEKPAPTAPARVSHRPAATHRDPRPEIEQEAEDFGSGVSDDPRSREALYDPGPETVVDHAADIEEASDPLDDGAEGDEPAGRDEGVADEGGKRRRRRRRRKKKGGAPEGGVETEPVPVAADSDDEETTVEEGEAPAELEGNDDDEVAPSAVDEEMEAEAAHPRPEWHVMSWAELVSKLYRPS
jgi:ribonuclease E